MTNYSDTNTAFSKPIYPLVFHPPDVAMRGNVHILPLSVMQFSHLFALFVLFLGSFLPCASAQTCTNNLLQNPSFETNLTSWDGTGGVTSTVASSGTQSLKLCALTNVRQMLPTTAGKTFTLTYKARTETTGANDVLVYVKFLSAGFMPLLNELSNFSTTAVYTQGTFLQVAPAGTAWIEIGFFKNSSQCVLIDEVCLTEAGATNPCAPDATPPVLVNCPASQNLTTATSTATAVWTPPTATDACPGTVTITTTHAAGTSFPLGATNVVYTARDAANNAGTCGFNIVVTQTGTPPCAISAVVSNVVCNNAGTPTVTTDDTYTFDVLVTQNGNCSPAWSAVSPATTGNYAVLKSFGPFPISAGNRTIQFRDAVNTAVTVTVTATAPATCSSGTGSTCANNLLQNPGFESNLANWDGGGGLIATPAASGVNAVKLCQNGALRQTFATTGTINDQTLRFKARTETTGANNVLSYIKYLSAAWQVLGTEFYDFTTSATYAEGSFTKTKPAGTAFIEIGFFKSSAGCVLMDDICLTESSTINPCAPDVTAPVIANCPSAMNLITAGTSIIANWAAPTATDVCPGVVTLTTTNANGSSFPLGATTVTYTARDVANNTSTCRFVVTVSQSSATCAGNLLQNNGFESNFLNWEGSGATISTVASAGTKSARLCVNAAFHQILPASAGQTMRVTVSARSETANTDLVSVYIKYLASNYQPMTTDYFQVNTTANYAQSNYTKTAPVGVSFVEVGFYKPTAGCVLVDDVCLALVIPAIPIPVPPIAVCTVNKLQNGGFESDLSGWDGQGALVSTTASAGTKSVKLCQNATVRQYFTATAGQAYGLLFKARSEAPTTDFVSGYIKFMTVNFNPISTDYVHPTTTSTYTQAKLSKVAPAGTAFVEVGFFKPLLGCVLVDEVCFSLVTQALVVGSSPQTVVEVEEISASLYPNPASDVVYLNMRDLLDKENVSVTIYDAKGLIIKDLHFPKVLTEIEQISLEDFQSGFYVVRTQAPGMRPLISKLLVQRL